jgi:hypothetical protein
MVGLTLGEKRSMRQGKEPAASPPLQKTSRGVGSSQTKLAALLDEMRRAARKTGVDVDGPLGPVLSALILVLEWLGVCVAELRMISVEYGSQALQRLQAVRAADEAATSRLQTQMEAAKIRIVHDFRADIARDFDKLTVGRVRAEVWKISLIATVVLIASVAVSLIVGYRWGRTNATASIYETESRLQAAFRNGLPGASHWAGLMAWNDILIALQFCDTNADLVISQHGRRACKVPLWIEPDHGAPDAVLDDIEARAIQLQKEAEESLRAAQARDQAEGAPSSTNRGSQSERSKLSH